MKQIVQAETLKAPQQFFSAGLVYQIVRVDQVPGGVQVEAKRPTDDSSGRLVLWARNDDTMTVIL
jgi:hypothetical protein